MDLYWNRRVRNDLALVEMAEQLHLDYQPRLYVSGIYSGIIRFGLTF
jgi:hypothetical protein